jgi:hypothetical protein
VISGIGKEAGLVSTSEGDNKRIILILRFFWKNFLSDKFVKFDVDHNKKTRLFNRGFFYGLEITLYLQLYFHIKTANNTKYTEQP